MAAVLPVPLQPFPQRQPLLPNPYHQLDQVNYHEAYNHCLQCEAEAGTGVTRLMFARCLGYLILEAPTSTGRDMISDEILECNGNRDDMEALARLYINHLLRLCESIALYSFAYFISCQSGKIKGRLLSQLHILAAHSSMITGMSSLPRWSLRQRITNRRNVL